MKKKELIKLGKEKYNLDSKTVNQVLEFVFCLSKEKVFLLDEIDSIYNGQIIFIFERLFSGYPIAYIIKKANFMGIDFYVDENVLIPRDDTEVLVKEVVFYCEESNEAIYKTGNNIVNGLLHTSQGQGVNGLLHTSQGQGVNGLLHTSQGQGVNGLLHTSQGQGVNGLLHTSQGQRLLDIGTGSGIIPISLAKSVDFKGIYAIDISNSAVEIAKENVFRNCLENKIVVLNTDFKKFDFSIFKGENLLITANLPYIKEKDYENMDFGVYNFEPKLALYGGKETGFELYEGLITLLIERRNLFNSLVLFIEIGFDQFDVSNVYLSKNGLKFEFFKDTNNIHRVIKIIL